MPVKGPDGASGASRKAVDIEIWDLTELSFPVSGQQHNTNRGGSSKAGRHQCSDPSSAKRGRIGFSQGGEPFPSTRSVNDSPLQNNMPRAALAASPERTTGKIANDPPRRSKTAHIEVSCVDTRLHANASEGWLVPPG